MNTGVKFLEAVMPTSHSQGAARITGEAGGELVDTNWGIQKVGVEPATRSVVATWILQG